MLPECRKYELVMCEFDCHHCGCISELLEQSLVSHQLLQMHFR